MGNKTEIGKIIELSDLDSMIYAGGGRWLLFEQLTGNVLFEGSYQDCINHWMY